MNFGPLQAIKGVADSCEFKDMHSATAGEPWEALPVIECTDCLNALTLAKGCNHFSFSPSRCSVLDLAKLKDGT